MNPTDAFPDSYTVFDLETTGFSSMNDDIIQIGVLEVEAHTHRRGIRLPRKSELPVSVHCARPYHRDNRYHIEAGN